MKSKKIFGIAMMAILASSIFIPSNSSNISTIIPSIYSESPVQAAPSGYHWIQATNNGAWLWNPEPGAWINRNKPEALLLARPVCLYPLLLGLIIFLPVNVALGADFAAFKRLLYRTARFMGVGAGDEAA